MELVEIQKHRHATWTNGLEPDGEPIVYELMYSNYIEVQSPLSGSPYWHSKDHYTPHKGDEVLCEYPNGVYVVGVDYFPSRQAFLDMMKRYFHAEVIASVEE